jgi:hypothetical protein
MKLKTLLILPLLAASLQAASVDDLTFTLNDDGTEYIVLDCLESASGSLDIPSTYSGLPVTSIGIGAFQQCLSLNSITIPDSVTSIQNYALSYCASLTSITIGSGVTSFGYRTLYNSDSLTSITLNNASLNLSSIGSDVYSRVTSITIPEGTTEIADYAFYRCSNITSITFPDSVTSIGREAFYGCQSLENVTLNENLVSIKYSAFTYCVSLETISIPSTVRDLGTYAFGNCSELREITFEGPPPAFSITDLQGYNITPTMYYKASPQSWAVYQSSYGLPLVYLGPPTIQVQPQDAIASIGDSIMLSVEATDVRETALSYQWMCNGIEIAGKTAANLSLVSLAQSDVGNYQVKVTNAEGTTFTEGASVTIADGGISNGLYTQQQYDAALTSGFNLGVQSVGGSSDSGGSSGTPAATSAILDVYYSTDLTTWDLMESIEVENPPAGQMFMKTELTPPSE